jgi:hypothetical protein
MGVDNINKFNANEVFSMDRSVADVAERALDRARYYRL